MKKPSLLFIALLCMTGLKAQTEVKLLSFEEEPLPCTISTKASAEKPFDVFPEVRTNPYKKGINTSEKVVYAKTIDNGAIGWWENSVTLKLSNPTPIDEKKHYLHVMHYRSKALTGWSLSVNDVEASRGKTAANQWVDLVFELRGKIETIQEISIHFNTDWGTPTCPEAEFLIDEIVLSDSPVPRGTAGGAGNGPFVLLNLDQNVSDAMSVTMPTSGDVGFVTDVIRGSVAEFKNSNAYIAFDKQPFGSGSMTMNALYKKASFEQSDNGKYIYQANSASGDFYGLRLKMLPSGKAVVEMVTSEGGKEVVTTGKETQALNPGEWNSVTIWHSVNAGATKGTMRIYVNGAQTCAKANVTTDGLSLNSWRIGGKEAGSSLTGCFEEIEFHNRALSTGEVSNYMKRLTTFIDIAVDVDNKKQTIHNFGSSDAWDTELIGKTWPLEKKEKLAELLFSKDCYDDGTPKGVGLSCWRFNIGSGSADQGDASFIHSPSRRTEGFLKDDGTYDWTKQAGQRWFLEEAVKKYKVETIVGWTNSPPIQYTRENLAFNRANWWNTILRDDQYDEYARFLGDVVTHFNEEGIPIQYISPLNEPEYQWGASTPAGTADQEGSHWTMEEIARTAKALSAEFSQRNIPSEVFLAESGSMNYLFKGDQNKLGKFWGHDDPALRVAGLPNISNIVSAHSYWTDYDGWAVVAKRLDLGNYMKEVDENLQYWQTEYSLLSGGFTWGHVANETGLMTEIQCAISLARVIHYDLIAANATGWQFWTTFAPNKHGGESRFSLIEAVTNEAFGEKVFNDNKLLYALGSYSRFVRPGMKRVELGRNDNVDIWGAINDRMFSAYTNEDNSEVVIVAINATTEDCNIRLNVNIPDIDGMKFTPYVTTAALDHNMKAYPAIGKDEQFLFPGYSIVTFVGRQEGTGIKPAPEAESPVRFYPNPAADQITVSSTTPVRSITLRDISGRVILKENYAGVTDGQKLYIGDVVKGIYILSFETSDNKVYSEKLFVK